MVGCCWAQGARGGSAGGQATRPTSGLRQEGPGALLVQAEQEALIVACERGTSPREVGGAGPAPGPSGGKCWAVGSPQRGTFLPPAPQPAGAIGRPHAGVFNA